MEISIQSIDHLVAGMIEELGIVEEIDRLLPSAKELSHGKAIAAMILNGLGYANKRLLFASLEREIHAAARIVSWQAEESTHTFSDCTL